MDKQREQELRDAAARSVAPTVVGWNRQGINQRDRQKARQRAYRQLAREFPEAFDRIFRQELRIVERARNDG